GGVRTPGAFSNVVFPLYDAHGNMIATIARSSGNSFTSYNARAYDAWGNIRVGQGTGDPKNRYCASAGHQQDEESGLIYMRARYYDSRSARFVSQDPGMSGINWFSYCGNEPVDRGDPNGRLYVPASYWWVALGFFFAGMSAYCLGKCSFTYIGSVSTLGSAMFSAGAAGVAVGCFAIAQTVVGDQINGTVLSYIAAGITIFAGMITMMAAATQIGVTTSGIASVVVLSAFTYGLMLLGTMIANDADIN
ncbi:MAG: RHS repeat-associated core domain-containing protein, partial [Fimbriimonas sp.]|nr:RHS repeat-associated core domain-containing protein [Fimbriimonas sp.]